MRWLWKCLAIGYLALVATGVLQFKLWGQVTILWASGATPGIVFSHVHGLRYLVVYWIFWLADVLGTSADYIFSLVVAVIILITARLVVDTVEVLEAKPLRGYWFWSVTVGLLLMGLSVFMNGRISFSILGMAFLIYSLVRWEAGGMSAPRMLFIIVLAFLLSSVSSGTFLVGVIFLLAWLAFMILNWFILHSIKKRDLAMASLIMLALMIVAVPAMAYVIKNVSFYGGGTHGTIIMLTHGAGAIFNGLDILLTAYTILASLLFGTLLLFATLAFRRYRAVLLALATAIIGGLFGYSALATGIAPALVLCIIVCHGFVRLSPRYVMPRVHLEVYHADR